VVVGFVVVVSILVCVFMTWWGICGYGYDLVGFDTWLILCGYVGVALFLLHCYGCVWRSGSTGGGCTSVGCYLGFHLFLTVMDGV